MPQPNYAQISHFSGEYFEKLQKEAAVKQERNTKTVSVQQVVVT